MSQHRRPIVIRRKKIEAHASHGTWKIAYADFMTAMMAFFLVMWLLSGTSKSDLEQVGEYFRTPLKVALTGGDKSTASNSAIPGGGDDVIHSDGEIAKTVLQPSNYQPDRSLRQLKARLETLIREDPALSALRSQLKLDLTPQGLRIQIIDSRKRPMFELGSARVEPYMRDALRRIAPLLNELPNGITLAGHTDDLPYAQGQAGYSNWELSSDRANASRRELVAGGLDSSKLLRVIGMAATMNLDAQPQAPINRRISIMVLNHDAQQQLEQQNGSPGRAMEINNEQLPSRLGEMLGVKPVSAKESNNVSAER